MQKLHYFCNIIHVLYIMSKHPQFNPGLSLCVQFEAEFRRFSLPRSSQLSFDQFYRTVERLHNLQKVPFLVTYTDKEGDLLPINNDDNFLKALGTARPLLRLCIQRKGNVLH